MYIIAMLNSFLDGQKPTARRFGLVGFTAKHNYLFSGGSFGTLVGSPRKAVVATFPALDKKFKVKTQSSTSSIGQKPP